MSNGGLVGSLLGLIIGVLLGIVGMQLLGSHPGSNWFDTGPPILLTRTIPLVLEIFGIVGAGILFMYFVILGLIGGVLGGTLRG